MKLSALTIAVIASTAVLSGCAFVPAHFEGIATGEIPSGYVAPERTVGAVDQLEEGALLESPEVWFARWKDPNIKTVVEAALQNNTTVAKALANLRSSQAGLVSTTAALFPSANVGADAAKNRRNHASTESYSADVSGSWTFSFGGKELAERRASNAQSAAAREDLKDAQAAAASQAVEAYLRMVLADIKTRTATENAAYFEKTYNLTKSKYANGLVGKDTLDAVASQLHSARASAASASQALKQAKTALMTLTHLPLTTLDAMKVDTVTEPEAGLAARISARTIAARPDVESARLNVVAAMESLSAAQASYLPDLRLSGSFGTQAATIGALGASGTSIGALMAALSAPILNWGSVYADTERKAAQLDSARAQYVDALFVALEETENALSAIETGLTEKKASQEALRAASSARAITDAKYAAGLTDYLDLLEKQRAYISAKQTLATAQTQYAIAHIELYRALGGGWVTSTKE